jgi:uncharacterized protein (DUF736 family)
VRGLWKGLTERERWEVACKPDYRITHEDAAGLTEFGAAWKRESEKGDHSFLSS